jgi:hypothetical protein
MGDDREDEKAHRLRKPRSPYYRANNAGGYGNPPVSGQRKKGDPGGPGRPRGQTSLQAALRRALRKKRPVLRDGKVELLHPSDIMAERIVEALLAKNLSPAMIDLAYRIMEKFGPQMPQEGENQQHAFAWDSLSDDELDLFGGIIARATGAEPLEDHPSGFGRPRARTLEGYYCATRRADGHIVVEKIDHLESGLALLPGDVP